MLILREEALAAAVRHALGDLPREACGLLLGTGSPVGEAGALRRVLVCRPAKNLEQGSRGLGGYFMDPLELLGIQEEARRRRLGILGAYHSHPGGAAAPSETDRVRARAVWPRGRSWSYLILGVGEGGAPTFAAWILEGGVFREERVVLDS